MQKLPQFSHFKANKLEPELSKKLSANRNLIKILLKQKEFSWHNFIQPLEDIQVELNNFWAILTHLHGVVSTEELRLAYGSCLLLMTDYLTEIGANKGLYQAYKKIKNSAEFQNLSLAQKKVIDNRIRDCQLAGVALSGPTRKEFQEIELKLSKLSNQFQQNIMDATDSWSKLIEEEKLLIGLPDRVKQLLKQNAERKQLVGWLLTLDFPTFFSIVAYADNRELRQEIYTAYFTRASDQDTQHEEYDNSEIMFNILMYRDKKAKLLGFKHFGEFSLAPKMANSTEEVIYFLTDLAEKIKPIAVSDWKDLVYFAETKLQLKDLKAWDVAYATEKLRAQQCNLTQEQFRPYFEVNYVINGLFQIAEKLYEIKIVEYKEEYDKWHDDVKYYEIYGPEEQLIAGFYLDPYARPKKRGGAWMDSCRARHRNSAGDLQLPIAFLVCNFSQPLKNQPSLLTHEEVRTLFHEFGHGLHHMLTKIDIASISGLNGVEWDAVEFPSQFMENWCWHQTPLDLIALHHQDKTPLPNKLFQSLIYNKHFQIGIHSLRQLELALFDFRIHSEFSGENQIQAILNTIRDSYAIIPVPEFHRYQHCFSHIFSGGYAAGFYSYKWAEVLASDAFSGFEQGDIFDLNLSNKFKNCILEKGGSERAAALFSQYQGRPPSSKALLKGLETTNYISSEK